MCGYLAPTVFELDDGGLPTAIDPHPRQDLHEAVEEAVNICPSGAITASSGGSSKATRAHLVERAVVSATREPYSTREIENRWVEFIRDGWDGRTPFRDSDSPPDSDPVSGQAATRAWEPRSEQMSVQSTEHVAELPDRKGFIHSANGALSPVPGRPKSSKPVRVCSRPERK